MFMDKKGMCPVCGRAGKKSETIESRTCPVCRTVFNEFGIILSTSNGDERKNN